MDHTMKRKTFEALSKRVGTKVSLFGGPYVELVEVNETSDWVQVRDDDGNVYPILYQHINQEDR